ncbi:MAG TPA: hypothetical protein VN636_05770, partial [Acidimicrobiia bacterium]|nr:hypothetical protein [Acidimicrobiia bacterium]
TAIELLQPDRIAPDVQQVRAAIERAGAQSGQGDNIPIVVDTSYDFAKGWLWYLRAYPNLTLEDMRKGYRVPAGTIALFDARNRPKVDVESTSSVLAFTSSWSFPGDNARLTPGDVASDLSRPSWWSTWSRYLVDRTRAGQPVAVGGVAYFPQALSAALPASRQSNVLAATVAPLVGPSAPTPAR